MLGKFENIWTKDKSYFQIILTGGTGDGNKFTLCKNIYIKTDKYTLGFKVLDDNGFFIVKGNLDNKRSLIELKNRILQRMNYAGCYNIDTVIYKKKVINKADKFERYFVRFFPINNLELIVKGKVKTEIESLFLNFDRSSTLLYKDENGGYMNLGEKTMDILETVIYNNKDDDIYNYHYLPVNVEINIKLNRKYIKKLYGEN